MATIKKACKGALYPKSSSVSKRLKSGGSFPDLNKDGKVTKKDVLIGRGVLPKTAKKSKMVKKAQNGIIKSQNLDSAGNVKNTGLFAKKPYKISVDTSGYSDGKKRFPGTYQTTGGKNINETKSSSRTYSRNFVDKTINKNKTGGKMKKCAYGCK